MNWIIIVALLVFVAALVYVILPKIANSDKVEKAFKIALYLGGAGYVTYDLFTKEKTALAIALLIGSVVFVYVVVISKKKN